MLALACVGGCAAAPGTRDSLVQSRLDGCPVVPVRTRAGLSTGWFIGPGELVMCSHPLDRGTGRGEIAIAGWGAKYEVIKSGDELKTAWGRSDRLDDSLPKQEYEHDWAVLRLSPSLSRTDIFATPTFDAILAKTPAQTGELLYVVGFTVPEDDRAGQWATGEQAAPLLPLRIVREVEVVELPSRFAAIGSRGLMWVRSRGGEVLHVGFSGAPLWRARADGKLEICGLLSGAERNASNGAPTDLGVALHVPARLRSPRDEPTR